MQVVCEHPRIILNPNFAVLFRICKQRVENGELVNRIYRDLHAYDVNIRPYNPKRNNITIDDLDNWYFIDKDGEHVPMYLSVRCGKCDICKKSKVNSFVHRCLLESEMYDCVPWFVTLTYDEQSLPRPAYTIKYGKNNYDLGFSLIDKGTEGFESYFDDILESERLFKSFSDSETKCVPTGGVSVRELQLFFKRFRINLQRAGFDFKIRYVAVGEYGRKTHRPHYHAIIWGLSFKDYKEQLSLFDILKDSWSKGIVRSRPVDLKDDKCFYYTSKYLTKDCFVPDGCRSTFMISSRGHGGIGSAFIDNVKKKIQKSLNTDFKFLSKWTNKVVNLQYSRYVIDRLFPSFSRSVPAAARNSVVDVYAYSQILKANPIKHVTDDFINYIVKFADYFYIGFGVDFTKSRYYSISDSRSAFRRFGDACQRFYDFTERLCFFEIEEKYKIGQLRRKFLDKLFRNQKLVDIVSLSYSSKKILSWRGSGEVL